MYKTIDDLNALLGVAAESVTLEFKDGAKLQTFDERAKKELVTDVTAFANAGGGTVIYGIQEAEQNGVSVASAHAPVTNGAVNQDRLREVILSNTDPVFRDFKITPIASGTGTVYVIEIAKGDTAHQNKIDRRYYSRIDASAVPMYDFAIRDVMNRRSTPKVAVEITVLYNVTLAQRHNYTVVPVLTNEGHLTANHWTLILGVPITLAAPGMDVHGTIRPLGEKRIDGLRMATFAWSSERQPPASSGRLLPGESLSLGTENGYGMLNISIENAAQIREIETAPPLHWSLFVDNAPRHDGVIPCGQWSRW
jgi:hypothetical protein